MCQFTAGVMLELHVTAAVIVTKGGKGKICHFVVLILCPGAHAQRAYSSLLYVCVCVSVTDISGLQVKFKCC